MVEFKNRSQVEDWLGRQSGKAAVVLAARSALRALPIILGAKQTDFTSTFVLPVFRAAVTAWATSKYPAHQKMGLAQAAAVAYPAVVATASATDLAFATIDSTAILGAGARRADGLTAVAAAAASTAVGIRTADAYTAATAARAAAAAARTAACPDDCYARISALRTAAYAAAYASDAIYAAAYADARNYALAAADSYSPDTARAAACAGDAAVSFFWLEISTDASRLEEGRAASDIARLPLWPLGQPVELQSLWQELENELVAAKQDWQVWTSWYEDRLAGRIRDEARELAYVRISDDLWKQGAAIVNAELSRQCKEGTSGRNRPSHNLRI